jgi:hypothetical protein
MRSKVVVLLVAVLASFIALEQQAVSFAQGPMPETVKCTMPFRAAVQQGASKGTMLDGNLTFQVDKSGDLQGELAMKNNTKVPVFGQVVGRAVSLIFELQAQSQGKAGSYIYGTGTTRDKILESAKTCGGTLGGTFAGPQDDDLGTWLGTCANLYEFNSSNDGLHIVKICAQEDVTPPNDIQPTPTPTRRPR